MPTITPAQSMPTRIVTAELQTNWKGTFPASKNPSMNKSTTISWLLFEIGTVLLNQCFINLFVCPQRFLCLNSENCSGNTELRDNRKFSPASLRICWSMEFLCWEMFRIENIRFSLINSTKKSGMFIKYLESRLF